jgi:zinc transport system substrate-binding protein
VGLDLDTWTDKIVKSAASDSTPFLALGPLADPVAMTEHLGEEEAEEGHKHGDKDDDHHHEEGGKDPHYWLDPVRVAKTVDAQVEAFAKLAPDDAAGLKSRGDELKKALEKLHGDIEARAKTWSKKSIVTFHGSFGYYAARYGLTIAAVVEPFPGKEPTPKYVNVVLKAIEAKKPAALFSEPQLDKRPAQVIAEQAKLPLFELDPVGGGGALDSYEKLLLANTETLEKALK